MKYKMMALILALSVVTWAQTATQTTPPAPQQSTAPADKDKCPCCDKMAADAKDARAGHMMHHDMSAKDSKGMASCCAGKDAKSSSGDKEAMSCMKGGKDKTADSCCAGKDDMSCMKGDKDKAASCCGDKCAKDKTASACCGGDCGKEGEKGCCSKKAEKTAMNCCQHKTVSENATTAELGR